MQNNPPTTEKKEELSTPADVEKQIPAERLKSFAAAVGGKKQIRWDQLAASHIRD